MGDRKEEEMLSTHVASELSPEKEISCKDRTKCQNMEEPGSIPVTQTEQHIIQVITSTPSKFEILKSLSKEHPALDLEGVTLLKTTTS